MAVIITAPVTGSLKIFNSSASPQSNYLCNLQTMNISGDPFNQAVNIANSEQQTIYSVKLSNLSLVGAASVGTLQAAVDAIATLIMK